MPAYPAALLALNAGTLLWNTDSIRALLLNGLATYNRAHATVTAAIDGNELTGLTRVTLAGKTVTDNGSTRIVFDANDLVFAAQAGGQTLGAVLVYKFITDDANSLPIAFVDGANITTDGTDVTIVLPSTGVFNLQYA